LHDPGRARDFDARTAQSFLPTGRLVVNHGQHDRTVMSGTGTGLRDSPDFAQATLGIG
jgi:hypothetical protein